MIRMYLYSQLESYKSRNGMEPIGVHATFKNCSAFILDTFG